MERLPLVMVNGTMQSRGEGLPFSCRSFFVGEGLFETFRVSKGRCEFEELHLARLVSSADALGLPSPSTGMLKEWLAEFLCRTGLEEGMLRLTLTREGEGGLEVSGGSPVVLITGASGRAYPSGWSEAGIPVRIVRGITRVADDTARHKTVSFMPFVAARREAVAGGGRFGVLCNQFGRVAEADCANVFVLGYDGILRTPPVEDGALPGVVRRVVLEKVARAREEAVEEEGLLAARAVFLTNSLMPVLPVREEVSSGRRFEGAPDVLEEIASAVGEQAG